MHEKQQTLKRPGHCSSLFGPVNKMYGEISSSGSKLKPLQVNLVTTEEVKGQEHKKSLRLGKPLNKNINVESKS